MIPHTTEEFLNWLDELFPERSPRNSEEYEQCLRRGAVRDLITTMKHRYRMQQEDED